MIIRWISLVPSKMVKIFAVWAVSAGRKPADLRGINTPYPAAAYIGGMSALTWQYPSD
jgi:hypothetical protein